MTLDKSLSYLESQPFRQTRGVMPALFYLVHEMVWVKMLRCYVNVRFGFLLPLLSRTFPVPSSEEFNAGGCTFSLEGNLIHFSLSATTSPTAWQSLPLAVRIIAAAS